MFTESPILRHPTLIRKQMKIEDNRLRLPHFLRAFKQQYSQINPSKLPSLPPTDSPSQFQQIDTFTASDKPTTIQHVEPPTDKSSNGPTTTARKSSLRPNVDDTYYPSMKPSDTVPKSYMPSFEPSYTVEVTNGATFETFEPSALYQRPPPSGLVPNSLVPNSLFPSRTMPPSYFLEEMLRPTFSRNITMTPSQSIPSQSVRPTCLRGSAKPAMEQPNPSSNDAGFVPTIDKSSVRPTVAASMIEPSINIDTIVKDKSVRPSVPGDSSISPVSTIASGGPSEIESSQDPSTPPSLRPSPVVGAIYSESPTSKSESPIVKGESVRPSVPESSVSPVSIIGPSFLPSTSPSEIEASQGPSSPPSSRPSQVLNAIYSESPISKSESPVWSSNNPSETFSPSYLLRPSHKPNVSSYPNSSATTSPTAQMSTSPTTQSPSENLDSVNTMNSPTKNPLISIKSFKPSLHKFVGSMNPTKVRVEPTLQTAPNTSNRDTTPPSEYPSYYDMYLMEPSQSNFPSLSEYVESLRPSNKPTESFDERNSSVFYTLGDVSKLLSNALCHEC